MGLHLGLPNVNWNFQIDKIVFFIHELLRMDVNNPLVSLDTYRTQFVIQEDMSGNFLMFLFLIGTCFWILFQKDAIAFKGILLCALAGFLVFCTATKFQLWSSRTHLPLFAQGTILVGFLLSKCTNRWRIAIAYLFVLAALPYVFDNFNKPLIPLRYASKYILGYIPQYLCLPSEANIALYRKSFDNSYNFEEGSPCFPLKNTPSYTEKQEMITKLSNLGYYKRESEHIFKHPREAYFFINDASFLSTYSDFKSLTKLIPQSTQTVGLMFNHQLGFYHYWHLLKKYLSPNVQMKYVLFHKEYLVLPNANRIFAYEYLLCDNQKLIDKYISKKDIRAVYRTQSLLLVQLKKPSLTYYFITQ
ncbi:MAG: hypothetical protein R2822_03170 [Spirosomataceae bacterium]